MPIISERLFGNVDQDNALLVRHGGELLGKRYDLTHCWSVTDGKADRCCLPALPPALKGLTRPAGPRHHDSLGWIGGLHLGCLRDALSAPAPTHEPTHGPINGHEQPHRTTVLARNPNQQLKQPRRKQVRPEKSKPVRRMGLCAVDEVEEIRLDREGRAHENLERVRNLSSVAMKLLVHGVCKRCVLDGALHNAKMPRMERNGVPHTRLQNPTKLLGPHIQVLGPNPLVAPVDVPIEQRLKERTQLGSPLTWIGAPKYAGDDAKWEQQCPRIPGDHGRLGPLPRLEAGVKISSRQQTVARSDAPRHTLAIQVVWVATSREPANLVEHVGDVARKRDNQLGGALEVAVTEVGLAGAGQQEVLEVDATAEYIPVRQGDVGSPCIGVEVPREEHAVVDASVNFAKKARTTLRAKRRPGLKYPVHACPVILKHTDRRNLSPSPPVGLIAEVCSRIRKHAAEGLHLWHAPVTLHRGNQLGKKGQVELAQKVHRPVIREPKERALHPVNQRGHVCQPFVGRYAVLVAQKAHEIRGRTHGLQQFKLAFGDSDEDIDDLGVGSIGRKTVKLVKLGKEVTVISVV